MSYDWLVSNQESLSCILEFFTKRMKKLLNKWSFARKYAEPFCVSPSSPIYSSISSPISSHKIPKRILKLFDRVVDLRITYISLIGLWRLLFFTELISRFFLWLIWVLIRSLNCPQIMTLWLFWLFLFAGWFLFLKLHSGLIGNYDSIYMFIFIH